MAEIKWIKKYEKKVRVIPSPPKPQTNADRIRQMTDEELAEYLEEVALAAVRAYSNDDLLLKGELSKWWLKRLKKEAET